jgi:hypothetical protein
MLVTAAASGALFLTAEDSDGGNRGTARKIGSRKQKPAEDLRAIHISASAGRTLSACAPTRPGA